MINSNKVAQKVAETLQWAAGQATIPYFKPIVLTDDGDVIVQINDSGAKRFAISVEEVEA